MNDKSFQKAIGDYLLKPVYEQAHAVALSGAM
jgi:hypothetical protein